MHGASDKAGTSTQGRKRKRKAAGEGSHRSSKSKLSAQDIPIIPSMNMADDHNQETLQSSRSNTTTIHSKDAQQTMLTKLQSGNRTTIYHESSGCSLQPASSAAAETNKPLYSNGRQAQVLHSQVSQMSERSKSSQKSSYRSSQFKSPT